MATFVIAHGAWSGGWVWKRMRPLLQDKGHHQILTPTYTGLGERAHLSRPDIDLETHIADVLGVLTCEDLRNVILLGHSYGGMVATGAAERAAERIAKLIYLDAFVPRNGQSLNDLRPGQPAHPAGAQGKDWLVQPNPLPPDTNASDAAWMTSHRLGHPRSCFEQRIKLAGAVEKLPRTYIACTRVGPSDTFRPFAERARQEGWPCLTIDSSHNPHVTAPGTLARMLHCIATERWPHPVKAS